MSRRKRTRTRRSRRPCGGSGSCATPRWPRTENRRVDLAALYEQAKRREAEVSGKFHDFKSVDVALQRQVTLDEARRSVDLTTPSRPTFDAALLTEEISDPERLARAREEMAAVTNEVFAIRSRAENLLASMLPAPEAGYAVVPPEALEEEVRPAPEPIHNEVSRLKLDRYTVDSGRRVEVDGLPADFLALTSWYVIGPYPNPQRRNIDRVFPPEQMLLQQNLDDVYDDGTGRALRWQFHQERGPKLTPPNEQEYAIYYAYTELWSDVARPVTFYIGSDDKAKVWLNGENIYTSDNRLLGWMPDRGVVGVTLRQGTNRILFRVENGWLGCNWSLLVRDPSPPPASNRRDCCELGATIPEPELPLPIGAATV